MKTVLISNRKGGTGKSTTAVNLAGELAKQSSVLLIDFDTQGHASIGVGHYPNEQQGAHGIFSGKTLSETFLPTMLDNLTLAPAQEFFDVYEHHNLQGILQTVYEKERLAYFFDYCIIDTPPTYDALLKNALEVADAVIIPMVPHPLGIVGAQQMLRAIYQISIQMGKKAPFVGILPVLFNKHIQEHTDSIKEVNKCFGEEKIFSAITIDIALASQFKEQIPLVLSDKKRGGARDYKQFTKELKKRLKKGASL